jgi:CelD/BcsL family acetyltransferase involved in cellulose biosynthesis
METTPIRTRVLEGFDDPTFGPEAWEQLLHAAGSDAVYLTWHCQRAWWETLGRGRLLLIAAEQEGRVVALAPFYAESGMVYFVGSSFELDCLDFVGDVSQPPVLDALLETARARAPGFLGFRLYFVPDRTSNWLQVAAARLGLSCYAEDEMRAPVLDLAGQPATLADKKSLARYERRLRQEGQLEVQHLSDGEAILPHLEPFFDQHVARWEGTGNPSRFLNAGSRAFFERLTRVAAHTGWLRFTRIDWRGRPIAFHYGFCYRGRFYWGTPAFAVDLARHSPGQVLLRRLLLAARDEGARVVDFGTGDAPFKLRFATRFHHLGTWGLYPSRGRLPGHAPAAPIPTAGEDLPHADVASAAS